MAKIQPVYEDHERYPVGASASGKNAYYHRCEEVGHCAPYAACVQRMESRKDGRLETAYAACSVAIGNKSCPAIQMRREEVAQDRAIYFLNREKMQAFYRQEGETTELVRIAPYQRTATKIVSKPPVAIAAVAPVVKAPVKPAIVESSGNIYADAINAALQTKTSAPAPKSVVTAPPGMTPLEFARQRLQKGSA